MEFIAPVVLLWVEFECQFSIQLQRVFVLLLAFLWYILCSCLAQPPGSEGEGSE